MVENYKKWEITPVCCLLRPLISLVKTIIPHAEVHYFLILLFCGLWMELL